MAQASRIFSKSIHTFWSLFLAEGIAMILLGILAILLPPFIGLAVTILLGWLLIASGVFGILSTLITRHSSAFGWSLLSAIVTLAIGVILFAWPMGGMISLSMALAAFLALDGIFAIGMAMDHRRRLTPKWAWLLINGIVDLVFAAAIIFWLPQSAAWALGLIIGADMLIGGVTLVAMAFDARDA